jgi:hypothetical protein
MLKKVVKGPLSINELGFKNYAFCYNSFLDLDFS